MADGTSTQTDLLAARRALDQGAFSQAEALFRKTIAAGDRSPESARGLGYCLFQRNELADALPWLQKALVLAPDDSLSHLVMGRLCLRLGQPALAETHFQAILERMPGNVSAVSGLVDVDIACNRLDDAVQKSVDLLGQHPQSGVAVSLCARVSEWVRDPGSAMALYERACRLEPQVPVHRFHLGRVQLMMRRFETGWAHYEDRFAAGAASVPRLSSSLWNGGAVGHLLVLAEQGLGDVLQFARYLPQCVARVGRVTLMADPSLQSLLQRSFRLDVLPLSVTPVPTHDAHLPLLSVPHRLGLNREPDQPRTAYLRPDPACLPSCLYRRSPGERRRRVALAWQTSIAHSTEQRPVTRRSCELDSLLERVKRHPDVDFFLLNDETSAVATLPGNVIPVAATLHDFDDTAALLAQVDAVISVDTATVHLAGGLGKKTALLLPYAADWRWMNMDAGMAPWYQSVEVFRQTSPGRWEEPLDMAFSEFLAD
jgi:tetratricopeptide (TPR) repeat protein